MHSPYNLEIIDSCADCELRREAFFCNLHSQSLEAFESLKYATVFPGGAMLFVQGQPSRGVFLLCRGRAKLWACSADGRAIILRIAEPGDLLGLSATLAGKPYEVTAETIEPCQVNFIKREDFLRFLSAHGNASINAARQLCRDYQTAYEQVRSLGLSASVGEQLAKLILEWCEKHGRETIAGTELKLTFTREDIAQFIGSSRETVTRLLSEFKKEGILNIKGATLIVKDKASLKAMVDC